MTKKKPVLKMYTCLKCYRNFYVHEGEKLTGDEILHFGCTLGCDGSVLHRGNYILGKRIAFSSNIPEELILLVNNHKYAQVQKWLDYLKTKKKGRKGNVKKKNSTKV